MSSTGAQKLAWSVDDFEGEDEKFTAAWEDDDDDDDAVNNVNHPRSQDTSDDHNNADAATGTASTFPASAAPTPTTRRPPLSHARASFGGAATMTTPRVLLNAMNNKGNNTPGTVSTFGTPLPDAGEGDFEEMMRERNRIRKEREEYHMAAFKIQMGRLEDALAAETKRRVDATTSLDDLARTQVFEMEQRLKQQLHEDNKSLLDRMDALEARVQALEQKWAKDSSDQIELVQNKAADLTKTLESIQAQQDAERKARLKREGHLLQQVEQHAKEFEERWSQERNDRMQRMSELANQILRNEARMAMEQKRYEEQLEEEMALLKKELAEEIEERQAQDEEIVAALNRYTSQLQQSLSILSSD